MIAISRKIAPVMAICIGFLCLASVSSAGAGAHFRLDFQPASSTGTAFLGLTGPCNMAGFTQNTTGCATSGAAQETDPDLTPYFMEQVSIDNVIYWHQIIGDPEQGFAMEVYTQLGSTDTFTSYSGGRNSNFSFGLYRQDLDVQSGNGWDPLGLDPATNFNYTGNGTGDPTRVVMRQILGGTWNSITDTWSCGTAGFCMDFTKEVLDGKPRIAQTVNDPDPVQGITAYFELDMSNISYSDDATAGTIVNTVTVVGNMGNFDMATDVQKSTVTGGRYTFTPGAGWVDTGSSSGYQTWDYQEGTYSYLDGGFDHLNQDWATYFDPAQNPFPGPGNQGKCDSGAITGTCP